MCGILNDEADLILQNVWSFFDVFLLAVFMSTEIP
jgi:hypothetical protein